MSFRALLYTAAAVAFFIFMINRPAVEPPNANMQTDDSAAASAGSGAALTITAAGQTDDSGSATDSAPDDQQDGSEQSGTSGTDAGGSEADSTAQQAAAADNADESNGATQSSSANSSTDANTDANSTDGSAQSSAQSATEDNSSSAATTAADSVTASAANATQSASAASTQPDYARERRMSNEIRDAILEGEIFYLNDGSRSFMSIQTNAEERGGGALILHGRGFHPDWEDTVNPLRTGLAENGWTTLSLQMPVLEKDAKYYDYVPLFAEAGKRIQAGIRHLKQQGISPITIVAHSCGAHMAMQWVRDNGDDDIAAYVGLGMGATDFGQQMAEPFPLDKMQVPVLDVYGEEDFPAVIKMAPDRLAQMTAAGNAKSEQKMLPAADHYFTDKGDELVGVVSSWLNGL